MEEIQAGADIQHVISFDRPAYPSTFWLGELRGWGYYEISSHSPQLPLSLSSSLSFSLFPTASHSPLLLSLFSLARSSLSPTQLYSTGIDMGLSLPRARRHRERQYYTACPHTQTHTHIHTHTNQKHLETLRRHICTALNSWLPRLQQWILGWGRGLTVGGRAPPADWCTLLVLVVLVTVQYSILLHQRKSPSTLLIQVGVWWLRSLCHMDIWLRIIIRQTSLVISSVTESRKSFYCQGLE